MGTFVSAATIMASASLISSSVTTFFAPLEPLVSTLMKQSFAFAAFSRASAAIYVWAIPVGHEVTARIFFFASSFDTVSVLGFSSVSNSSMTLTNSSGVFAALSLSANSSCIINTESLLNTSKCTLSFVSGAAIRKSNVTGAPSIESKSTPSGITIAASPGAFTAAHLP